MRECWINVYVLGSGAHTLGRTCRSLDEAERAAKDTRSVGASGPTYRLHVRLKPEPGPLVIEPSAKPAGQGGQWHADRLAALMVKR